MSPAEAGAPAVAYLNSQYPSLSHTFIEREVRALRARGIRVRTFTIRAADHAGRLGGAHAEAARETTVILSGAGAIARDVLGAVARSPLGVLRAVRESQRLAPGGLRSRLRHLAYAAEGLRLAAELRRARLTHVHVHMANNGAAAALLACAYDPRLTYSLTIHGSAEFFHVDTWSLAPKAERAVFVRCISNFCRAQVMAWTRPEAWERFHVVPCGIDPDAFPLRGGSPDGPIRLLAVGRLAPIKGYAVLLDACAELSRRRVDWVLSLVGDGPERGALERRARDLGIADRVTFEGAVAAEAIAGHYRSAEVIVVSSFMESTPVVLMEGMACGLAVAGTRVGGIPDLVTDGVHGVLVAPGSGSALADGLGALATKRGRLADMGRSGREAVRRMHDIHDVGAAMSELLRGCLAPKSATAGVAGGAR